MGFSHSGSLLIIFFAVLISFGTIYTVTANTGDTLTDSYTELLSQQDDIHDTKITISNATWHTTDGNLTIHVINEGTTELSVDATDTLIDGEYKATTAYEIAEVDQSKTDIWNSDEQLRLENTTKQPNQVKVVTEFGIADIRSITPAGIQVTGHPISQQQVNDGYNEAAQIAINNTYSEDVTLTSITITNAENQTGVEPEYIHYETNDIPEVKLEEEPRTDSTITEISNRYDIGEKIHHQNTTLQPDTPLYYTLGEFRDEDSNVVTMINATISIEITYQDPNGITRTYNPDPINLD